MTEEYDYNNNQYIDDNTQLINQGGYGCVYYPSLRCNPCTKDKSCKTKFQKNKYVSKIQVLDNTTNEYIVSKIITSILSFENYFAPIVNLCKVDLNRFDENQVDSYGDKCGVMMKKKHKQFVMLHIPYIPNGNFAKAITKKKATSSFNFLIDSYNHLLQSMYLLFKNNIIHYDLKAENVLYDWNKDAPIVIDFGLSVRFNDIIKKLNLIDGHEIINSESIKKSKKGKSKYKKGLITSSIRSKLKKIFYVFAPDYYLWCLEIIFISFLLHGDMDHSDYSINYVDFNDGTYVLTIEDVTNICSKYVKNNKGLKGFSAYFNDQFIQLSINYYKKYIGMKSDEIIYHLLQYWYTWDTYSINIMYLKLSYYAFDNKVNNTLHYLYSLMLYEIHPDPKRRKLPNEIKFLLFNIHHQNDTEQELSILMDDHLKTNTNSIVEKIEEDDKTIRSIDRNINKNIDNNGINLQDHLQNNEPEINSAEITNFNIDLK